MNAVQKFLVAVGNSFSSSERSTSQEVALSNAGTRFIKRRPSMVDRIVFLEGTDPFDVGICKVKLNNMFNSSFFSICEVRECAKLLRVSTTFTSRTMDRLSALHCTHWDKMPRELVECIPEMISEVFTEGAYPEPIGEIISDQ